MLKWAYFFRPPLWDRVSRRWDSGWHGHNGLWQSWPVGVRQNVAVPPARPPAPLEDAELGQVSEKALDR